MLGSLQWFRQLQVLYFFKLLEGEKKSISLFLIIVLLATTGQVTADLYLPSLPAIAASFSVRPNMAQWSVSLYIWGLALSQLFYGLLADARGKKFALYLGLGLLLQVKQLM